MAERNLNFDEIVDRRGTDCLKYDFAKERGKPEDVLPLWVADMDFRTSSFVQDALIKRSEHGIFGYSESGERYFNAVASWLEKRHGWEVRRDWLIKTPGVVFALAMAVKAYTEKGDAVLIQQPVYYPFSEVISSNQRRVVSNDLVLENGRYLVDIEDFEKKIVDEHIKLFILCSPHNPTGRVFTKDELIQMGDICVKHGVTVVSDEIHNDFIFKGEHTVFASVKKEYEDISIVCTSPSKTFNLAGMLISNIFIPDAGLRDKFRHQMEAAGISQLSPLGITAACAAYEDGEEWFENVLKYINENILFIREYTERNLKGVKVIDSEGTYLVWLDFRGLGMKPEELEERIVNKAKLWLDSGAVFGKAGEGFQRINAAAPRAVIEECMKRIKNHVL